MLVLHYSTAKLVIVMSSLFQVLLFGHLKLYEGHYEWKKNREIFKNSLGKRL